MTKQEQIKLMTEHCSNKLLAHLSNELYHDYSELRDDFKEYQLALNSAISKTNKDFIKSYYRTLQNKKIRDIHQSLIRWREERHLDYWIQKKNLLGNVMEELTEFCRANSVDERIDALCDICVFTFNSTIQPLIDLPEPDSFMKLDFQFDLDKAQLVMNIIKSGSDSNLEDIIGECFARMYHMGYDPYLCLGETIKEISSRTGHYDNSIGKFVKDQGIYNDDESKKRFESEMKEFYLTAAFNYYDDYVDVIDDTNQEILTTYRLWYKANYNKCKLKVKKK